METIAIIGPESSGKTTLAQRLVQEHPGWLLVPEAAREMVEQQGYRYTEADVLNLAKKQIEKELAVRAITIDSQLTVNRQSTDSQPTVNRTAVFDTELIITKVWLLDKYGRCPKWIDDHIQKHPHSLYLLCAPDIPAVQDPARENLDRRQELFDWYLRELQAINANYKIIYHATDCKDIQGS